MGRGAWRAAVHGIAMSQTRLSTHALTQVIPLREAQEWQKVYSVPTGSPVQPVPPNSSNVTKAHISISGQELSVILVT